MNELNKNATDEKIFNYLETAPNVNDANDPCPLVGFTIPNSSDPKIYSQFANLDNTSVISPTFKGITACDTLKSLIQVSEFNKKVATVDDLQGGGTNNLYYYSKNVGNGKKVYGLACGTSEKDIGTIECCGDSSNVIELQPGSKCDANECKLQCLASTKDLYYCDKDKRQCSTTKQSNLMYRNKESCEAVCKVPDAGPCEAETDCAGTGVLLNPGAHRPNCKCACAGEGVPGPHWQDTNPGAYCQKDTQYFPGCEDWKTKADHPNYATIPKYPIAVEDPLTGEETTQNSNIL